MNAEQSIPIIKLDGTNYQRWRFEIESFLESRDLWEIVTGTEKEPEQVKAKRKWNSRMKMAQGSIRMSVEPNQYPIIDGKTTPKEMMEAIKARYEDNKPNKLLHTINELVSTKQEDGMSLSNYFDRIDSLKKKIEANQDIKIPAQIITALLVKGLAPEF